MLYTPMHWIWIVNNWIINSIWSSRLKFLILGDLKVVFSSFFLGEKVKERKQKKKLCFLVF